MTTWHTIHYETHGAVGVLTLNRPERMNALNAAMLGEIERVCDLAEADHAVRVLVLTGAEGNFSSGFDLTASWTLESAPTLATTM